MAGDPVDIERRWRRVFEGLVVAVVCFTALSCHVLWARRFAVVPFGDAAYHLYESAAVQQVMVSAAPAWQKALAIWTWRGLHPPLVYATTATWNLVTGGSVASSLVSQGIFTVLLVIGAYMLARRVGGPFAGTVGACLVAVDPVLLESQSSYFPDVAVGALAVWAMFALLSSEGFTKPGPSSWLGVALGLGLLAKYTMGFFVIVPVALACLQMAARGRFGWRAVVGWGGLGAMVVLAFGGLFGVALFHEIPPRDASLISPMVLGVSAAWLTICLGCFLLARRLPGGLCHSSRCLAIAGAVAGPWLLVNASVLVSRGGHEIESKNGSVLMDLARQTLHAFPPYMLGLLGLAAVVTLVSQRIRAQLAPVWLALVVGAVLSAVLPNGLQVHYLAPATALAAVIVGASIPRSPWVSLPAAGLALGLVYLVLVARPWSQQNPQMASIVAAWTAWTRAPQPAGPDPRHPYDEAFAAAILQALPRGADSVCVMDPETDGDNQAFFAVARAVAWSGRLRGTWRTESPPGHLASPGAVGLADPFSTTRLRSLVLARGQDASRFLPPAVDVVVAPVSLDAAGVQRIFGGRFRELGARVSQYRFRLYVRE